MNLREKCRKAAEKLTSVKGEPTVLWIAQIEQSHIDIAVAVAVELSKRLYRYHSDAVSTAVGKELTNLIQELKGESDE